MKNELEQKQQEIMENLYKEVDKKIKEEIANKVAEFINTNKINELVYLPYVEADSMIVAKDEFNKLKLILETENYNDLDELSKDKYDTVKKRYEEFGQILNLNHLVIISNEDKLPIEYKMKYLPQHINIQYIKTDKVKGTYVANRGQVIFNMIEEPTFENPTSFKADIRIVQVLKFPPLSGCHEGIDGTPCESKDCPICGDNYTK